MAEAEDLKSSKCGFDPHSGHLLAKMNGYFAREFASPEQEYLVLKARPR